MFAAYTEDALLEWPVEIAGNLAASGMTDWVLIFMLYSRILHPTFESRMDKHKTSGVKLKRKRIKLKDLVLLDLLTI